MHGALGEALMAVVFGSSIAGALFFMLGVAGVVGAGAGQEHRPALGIFGGGAIALGLWQFAVGHVLSSEADAFQSRRARRYRRPHGTARICVGISAARARHTSAR